MGETRAVIPFFRLLRKEYPDALIAISSTTETGHAEAKRSMPEAAAHFFLPLDFSWVVKRVMKRIHPNALILCESDFWYHLITQASSRGASVQVINGKISDRSAKRFRFAQQFTRHLFGPIDHLCVQSERYRKRFISMGISPERLSVTGNLKFDVLPKQLTPAEKTQWQKELGIQEKDRVIAIGSSHGSEEELILNALDPIWKKIPDLKVILVPRHPERFHEVAEQLKLRGYSLCTYSQRAHQTGIERIILIDAMGFLNTCYQLAEVAIVGGSFISTVGGHNIFEPVLLDIPVLFGPYMHTQLDLVELVSPSGAGKQVALEQLADELFSLLTDAHAYTSAVEACRRLAQEVQGSAQRTYSIWKSVAMPTDQC
jgi:3-deoxy-D-manno-octulosonic-acid transferase